MSAARGFTLIELLVAISLATIITLLGVSLMRTSINTSVNNEEALVRRQALRDAQRLIEYAWSGRQAGGFAAGSAEMQFLTSQKATGNLPLRFVCQPGERDDFALWFYKVPPPAAQPDPAAEALAGEMLVDGLAACSFGYLQAPQDDRQPARWKDEWPAGQAPPTLMRLDLATRRGALPPFVFAVEGT